MNDQEIPSDLQATERRLTHLGRQVPIDLHHKARLREELLRRHQELSAETTQRADEACSEKTGTEECDHGRNLRAPLLRRGASE